MAKNLVPNIFLVFVVLISLGTHALSDKGVARFPLYHREKFLASHFKDHHSLVKARLARDRARFKLLHRRHLQHSNSAPFLRPNVDFNETNVFEEGGEYVIVLKVGNPPQKVQLLVDMGTPFTWWQCQPGCIQCYSTPHHIFDTSMSSTYTQTDCFSGACDVQQLYIQGCVRRGEHQCRFSVHYVDQSVSEGIMATDTISTEEGVHLNNNFSFGCGSRITGIDMFNEAATGILGFVPGGYSFPTQLQANNFTFCLPCYNTTDGGTLKLNYYDEFRFQHSSTAILDIRMDRYYLLFSGIEMNEEAIPIPPEFWEFDSDGVGGVTIDTGTTITKFPEKAYDIFKDYFIRNAQGLPRAPGEDQLDTCFDVKGVYGWTVLVPKVKFLFKVRNPPLKLDVHQVVMAVSDHKYCLAFAAGGRTSIIGSWQLQGSHIGFKLPSRILGIQPSSCY